MISAASLAVAPEVAARWAERLSRGERIRIRVRGRSMLPFIPSGAELVVGPCPAGELARGDVAVVRTGAGVLVHRVDSAGADSITTQGDARVRADGPFPVAAVLGRVERVALGPFGYATSGVVGRMAAAAAERMRRLLALASAAS